MSTNVSSKPGRSWKIWPTTELGARDRDHPVYSALVETAVCPFPLSALIREDRVVRTIPGLLTVEKLADTQVSQWTGQAVASSWLQTIRPPDVRCPVLQTVTVARQVNYPRHQWIPLAQFLDLSPQHHRPSRLPYITLPFLPGSARLVCRPVSLALPRLLP